MAVLKCKMCGGDLDINAGVTVVECEYCGTKQTVPSANDEKKITLFGRANRLRFACEFDKAAGVYESIIADFPEEAEAYWGLVLCKYGIEYVDDPATAKKIPTCHRSSFDPVLDDSNFEQVMENADVIARGVYREEAKQIEELRKGIIEVSSKEEPYDIFICYKETDENGDRTVDSVIAQDVYTELVNKGYRVFFSRITLEDKLGQEYEPYIFAALNSAKIMLAFGTDYEYYNAVWVKNEWSRFLQLIAKGEKKTLIPCYKDIDAYDMPKEFAKLQAQDMGKVGAIQDLLRGIEKILPKETDKTETVVIQQSASNPTVDSFLKRAFMFLEDGDFNSANEYCEKVLDIYPECAEAYLGKLMADLNLTTREGFSRVDFSFKDHSCCKKIIRYADATLKREIEDYIETVEKNIIREQEKEEEQKRAEKERKTQNLVHLARIRERNKPAEGLIFLDDVALVTVNIDGSVNCQTLENDFLTMEKNVQKEISSWDNIVSIAPARMGAIGLRANGTVVAAGDNRLGQCNVKEWTNIVAIASSGGHTVGLKSNGTVVAVGNNNFGQCDVNGWTNIVAIAAVGCNTCGIKKDGTVVVVGDNKYRQLDANRWTDIVAIDGSDWNIVGLKADGTVVAVGKNSNGHCNVSDWTDITGIHATAVHTVGLKADGTVVAVGPNYKGECNVKNWRDIVALAKGGYHTAGIKSDGSVVLASEEYNVSRLKLFNDLDNFENEKAEAQAAKVKADALKANRRQQNLCQHCGGTFKGLFAKKCSSCEREKDY